MSSFPYNFDLDPASLPYIPVPEPRKIRAGDAITWQRSFDAYPPSGGYTLSYVFVSRNSQYVVAGAAIVEQNGNYVITVPSATTAKWVAGWYRWQAYIIDSNANRTTVGEGMAEVLPNLELATSGIDDREPDEVVLDNIKLMLSNKATRDVQEYKIADRELRSYSWQELTRMRTLYEQRVRKLRIARGERLPSRTIGVSFRNGY